MQPRGSECNELATNGAGPRLGFALLHLLCCGIPLLLLSGVSVSFLAPYWPWVGAAVAALALADFTWHRSSCGCARRSGKNRAAQVDAIGRQQAR